jgi:hypothetical protein
MNTVIPFSGGLDSTYCAWKTLSSSDDSLTLVFFDLQNTPEDLFSSVKATFPTNPSVNAFVKYRAQKIHSWLSANVRPCAIAFVGAVQDQISKTEPNSPLSCLFPTLLRGVNSGQFDKILCTQERENDGFAAGSTGKMGAIRGKQMFIDGATRGEIAFPLLDERYTQATAIKDMPKDLVALTISCDSIQNGDGCGVCFKCSKRKLFCEKVESGSTPEQIYDWYIRQCEVDGKWWSMKDWVRLYVGTASSEVVRNFKNVPSWPSSWRVGEKS